MDPSHCLLQYICCLQDRYNRDYSWLLFDYIAYSAKNTGEHCVSVIHIHTCKCTTFIFVLIMFGLLHRCNIQDNIGWIFLQSYTLLTGLCEIVQFLLNTVITVNFFVLGQHRIFVISLVTCKSAILILQQLRFGVCDQY